MFLKFIAKSQKYIEKFIILTIKIFTKKIKTK